MPTTPPNRKTDRREFSTHTRTRFYTAYDLRAPGEGIKDVIPCTDSVFGVVARA
jgi:hypothetical protein